ncbi:uncharacterized protein LOC143896037 [Temnothorax americanus]|uniref:uncharacterized protein LOC143896037 n=1 Tax=Temnothorax americanus TaxID=1964332 RepID=UPI00406784E2
MSKRRPYKRYLELGSTRDIPRSTVKRRKKVDLSDLDALQTNNSQNNQQISTFDHDLYTLEESSNNEINEPSSLRVYEESVFQDADNDNNNEVIEENVDDTIYFETNLDEVVDMIQVILKQPIYLILTLMMKEKIQIKVKKM